jgi:hypothetical protein
MSVPCGEVEVSARLRTVALESAATGKGTFMIMSG